MSLDCVDPLTRRHSVIIVLDTIENETGVPNLIVMSRMFDCYGDAARPVIFASVDSE